MELIENLIIKYNLNDSNDGKYIMTDYPITLEEVKRKIAKKIGCDEKKIQISSEYHREGLIDTDRKFQQLILRTHWLIFNINLLPEHNEIEQLKKDKRTLLDKLNSVKSELESDKRVLLNKLTNTYSELSNIRSKNKRQETVVKMILNLAKKHDSELFQKLEEYLG